MKKLMMIIAAMIMTGIFAQANENVMADAEAKVAQAVQEATDAAPAPTDEDKNKTTEEAPQEEK
jgi:type II secretory pathway pseudopilin PulG